MTDRIGNVKSLVRFVAKHHVNQALKLIRVVALRFASLVNLPELLRVTRSHQLVQAIIWVSHSPERRAT